MKVMTWITSVKELRSTAISKFLLQATFRAPHPRAVWKNRHQIIPWERNPFKKPIQCTDQRLWCESQCCKVLYSHKCILLGPVANKHPYIIPSKICLASGLINVEGECNTSYLVLPSGVSATTTVFEGGSKFTVEVFTGPLGSENLRSDPSGFRSKSSTSALNTGWVWY